MIDIRQEIIGNLVALHPLLHIPDGLSPTPMSIQQFILLLHHSQLLFNVLLLVLLLLLDSLLVSSLVLGHLQKFLLLLDLQRSLRYSSMYALKCLGG